MLVRVAIAMLLLGAASPSHAAHYGFMRLTCVPEARFLEVEYVEFDEGFRFTQLEQNANGFFRIDDVVRECKFPTVTYRIATLTAEVCTSSNERVYRLSLLRDDDVLLRAVLFGDDRCSSAWRQRRTALISVRITADENVILCGVENDENSPKCLAFSDELAERGEVDGQRFDLEWSRQAGSWPWSAR